MRSPRVGPGRMNTATSLLITHDSDARLVNLRRAASLFHFRSLQRLRHLYPSHGAIRVHADAFPRELVYYRQDAKRATFRQLVVMEVHALTLVGSCRSC